MQAPVRITVAIATVTVLILSQVTHKDVKVGAFPESNHSNLFESLSTPTNSISQSEILVNFDDTLELLALRHGVTVEILAKINHIANPRLLYAGQYLSIPTTGDASHDAITTLGSNRSLTFEAVRLGISLPEIALANEIHDPLLIASGSYLNVAANSTPKINDLGPDFSAVAHPVPLESGHTAGIRIYATEAKSVTLTFEARDFALISKDGSFVGVFGIDRWALPGIYPVTLHIEKNDGTSFELDRRILVQSGIFQNEDIRLTSEAASALSDTQSIAEENAYIAQEMSGYTPEIYWGNLFELPTAGVVTSTYGTTRVYNDAAGVNTFHSGNDFAAQTGTPIYAPADGVVIDIGELAIRGLITIIDHGGGVYSGFWHQSSILVHEGETVKARQQIGTVGNTGLSTASHLHWELWVGGVPVDSLQWVREAFP